MTEEFKGSDALYVPCSPADTPEGEILKKRMLETTHDVAAAMASQRPAPTFTPDHAALLSQVMEWQSDDVILQMLMATGIANGPQLRDLADCISLTVDGDAQPGHVGYISEADCLDLVQTWLQDNAVRLLIAKRVAATHEGVTYEQAKDDLNALLKELRGEVEVVG